MEENPKYRAIELMDVASHGGKIFLSDPQSCGGLQLGADDFGLLRQCQGFRSLEQHAEAIIGDMPLARFHRKRLLPRLQGLAQANLLVEKNALLKSVPVMQKSECKISVTGIITRHRTAKLKQTLEGHLKRIAKWEKDVQCTVIDDSTDPAASNQNREAVAELSRAWQRPILYAGLPEREAFCRRLSERSGVELPIVRFALMPETTGAVESMGAARNALLLQTAGHLAFSSDDDSGQEAAFPRDRRELLRLSTSNALETWFYPDRENVLANLDAEPDPDLLGAHEHLLGKSTAQLMEGRTSQVQMDDMPWPELRRCLNGKVTITVSGLYGDSACPGPVAYLMQGGETRARLLADGGKEYRNQVVMREVIRRTREETISSQCDFWGASFGYDHRHLLPPFLPRFRNEDGIFGIMLRICFRSACSGITPALALHDPVGRRSFPADWRSHFGVMTINDCFSLLVGASNFPDGIPAEGGLRCLAAHLREFGRMPLQDFAAYLGRQYRQNSAVQIAMLESWLAQTGAACVPWAQDIAGFIKTLATRNAQPDPVQIRTNPFNDTQDPWEGVSLLHNLVKQFAPALEAWPQLVETAKSMGEDERAARVIDSSLRMQVPAIA